MTGSRIAQAPNEVSISPITSVTSTDIQQTGMVRTEDILNMLPQVSAEQSSGTSISSNGIATVSLRALGSNRTLVLINGRRMQPGGAGGVIGPGSNANTPDINQIPPELIERVDVLTGGASAVYGADAVAGVVNFIMNTHFEGVKIDGDYSYNNHENNSEVYKGYLADSGNPIPPSTVNTGQNRSFSIIIGSNFADGKGNATAYATYLKSNPAVGYQFDHAGCTLNGNSTNGPISCGGSFTGPHGAFVESGATAFVTQAVDPVTGKMRDFNGSDLYNYGALSYFQRAAEKYTAGAFVNYDINSHVNVYSETMFARNSSQAQYGPSGAFALTSFVTDCGTNPYLNGSAGNDPTVNQQLCNPTNLAQNQAFYNTLIVNNDPTKAISGNQVYLGIGRRNVEGGGRQDNYHSDSIRQVLGVKGGWGDVWTYDAYGSYGITDFSDQEANFLGTQQINNALNVVTDPQTGQPACAAAVNGTDPTCVPWNIYKAGGVTPAALAYLSVPATYQSNSTEYIVDGSVTGELGKYGIKLPTANSGLSVNIGSEYRSESFVFSPDYIFLNGFQAGGAPSQPINGGYHVWEGFTEARLPLIDDKPGAYLLSMDAGYRYSAYSLGFDTNTYKIGLEWAPIKDVRLRGGYNRAVRAPNIDELYTPAVVGAGGTADPCWGKTPVLSQAECQLTGLNPALYGHGPGTGITVNPAAQINTKTGGNTGLQPETADTYTVGVVFQPSFLPNFVMSLDAFSIKIKDTITILSSNTVITNCASTGDPALCGLIHRGPNGSLWTATTDFVEANYQNIGSLSTKGLDVASNYRWDFGRGGKVSFNLNGTYTKDYITQPLTGGPSYDCVGFYGSTCGAPLPTWRHVFTTNWLTPWWGLDLTLRWRFIGPSSVDGTSSDPQLSPAGYVVGADHIPGYNYIDFSAAFPVGNNVDLRFGVNNIADKDPPLVPSGGLTACPNSTCNNNTWVGTYDTLGRYIYGHIQIKF